jgi:hypothetical protein
MEDIIANQPEIQKHLGNLSEIANTSSDKIGSVLAEYEVSNSPELAETIRDEAITIRNILDGTETSSSDE